MFNIMLQPATLAVGKLVGFLLSAGMLVATVGAILIIATLINKHLTKKENEKNQSDDNQ